MPDIWAARIQARLDKAADERDQACRERDAARQSAIRAWTITALVRGQALRSLQAMWRLVSAVDGPVTALDAAIADISDEPDEPAVGLGQLPPVPALNGGAS
jgi:hypothetical protein